MTLAPEREQPPAERSRAPRLWGAERRHPAPPRVGGPAPRTDGAHHDHGDDRPKLAEGVELVGEYEGSGYKEPHFLARRGAAGVVQLSQLLHLVAEQCNGQRTYGDIAQAVSDAYGESVSADNVATLVEKLRPLGVLAARDGSSPPVADAADPLLGLKFKATLLPASAVQRLVRPLTPVFAWPLVVLVCLALGTFDVWLFFVHGLAQGLRRTVEQPLVFLVVGALVVVSAAMHEIGHAGALRASGGRPGRMGAGLYLAWPAFYTDVTDAYSLDRKGRLRTDLGGIYFNAITVLVVAGAYAATGFEPLLLICFVLQVQVLQQMLPLLRLDGYYVLSDLLGVPDLFRRTGPVLKRLLPGAQPDSAVDELTPRARRIITGWTLAVVPLLLVNLLYIVVNAPRILSTAWDSAARQIGTIQADTGATRAVAALQLVILLIPITGVAITTFRITHRAGRGAWSWSAGSAPRRGAVLAAATLGLAALVYAWWPDSTYRPYTPEDTGTVATGVSDVGTAGEGAPVLLTPEEAAKTDPDEPTPVVSPSESGERTASPSAEPTGDASPNPTTDADESPSPSPSESSGPSASPSPTSTP